MSEGRVEVVPIGDVLPVAGAEHLELTWVHGGYPVVFRSGEYRPGDLAVFAPVDTTLPGRGRIKAKRLRGQLSLGVLLPALSYERVGEEVSARLGATRYEPPETRKFGDEDRAGAPSGIPPIPVYDLEGLRRYGSDLLFGEDVVITEKLHGENWRAVCAPWGVAGTGPVCWVGSRTRWKSRVCRGWWGPGEALLRRLEFFQGFTVYGELYGGVGGYPYDCARGQRKIRLFDAHGEDEFLYYDDFLALAERLEAETVPELYRGPWDPDVAARLAEENSSLNPGHAREGVVVRPVRERMSNGHRVVLTLIGTRFLLASGSQERPANLPNTAPTGILGEPGPSLETRSPDA